MAKNEKNLEIRKLSSGKVLIIEGKSKKVVDVQKLIPESKFKVVKGEILNMGIVFTPKIEKLVRKELGISA